jgi:hypothetical protein
MDSILAFLGLSPVEEFRVITATITAASADIATVTTRDGFTAVLPASEFYAGKPFVIGSTHQLLLLGMLPTPVVSAIRPELVPGPLAFAQKWQWRQPPLTSTPSLPSWVTAPTA